MGIRGLMLFAGKSPDTNPCMLFIANIYFLVRALEITVFYNLRSGINIYNAQSSMSNLQAFHDCLALQLLLLWLSHFSHVQLCNLIDGSQPGSSVPGIFQARILEWVAISFPEPSASDDLSQQLLQGSGYENNHWRFPISHISTSTSCFQDVFPRCTF